MKRGNSLAKLNHLQPNAVASFSSYFLELTLQVHAASSETITPSWLNSEQFPESSISAPATRPPGRTWITWLNLFRERKALRAEAILQFPPPRGQFGDAAEPRVGWRPQGHQPCSDEGRGWVRGWRLTNARVRIRDGLEGIPVEKGPEAIAVLALGVVPAAVTHIPSATPARQVHRLVEVTAVRVSLPATSWEPSGVTRDSPGSQGWASSGWWLHAPSPILPSSAFFSHPAFFHQIYKGLK